jgi:acetyltransferase
MLDQFFHPKSIALIGASSKPDRLGYAIWKNLHANTYEGSIFPVNPKYKKLDGQTCYSRIKDLPVSPDLAIIVTPAPTVQDILAQCDKKDIRSVLILSAGFKEAGTEGERLFRKLTQFAKKHKIRIIGPNSLGLQSPMHGLNASFSSGLPVPGRLAFIAQSGAMGSAILDWAVEKNVGFSHFVSIGNMADVEFAELIDYFGTHNQTACILIYMENLNNSKAFISAAKAFSRYKPIVILKAGLSKEGADAAFSTTGYQAGINAVYQAAFQRAGIIRVHTVQQLFDCAQALATQPLPKGRRLAIITNAAGPAILATDTLIMQGGTLAQLSPETLQTLRKQLPENRQAGNPVDLLGDATPAHYKAAIHTCLFAPEVDGLLVLLTPQSLTDPEGVARVLAEEVKSVFGKPIYTSWMGIKSVRKGRSLLSRERIPWFPFPERAVTTFMHMVRYRENLDLLFETPDELPIELEGIQKARAHQLLSEALKQNKKRLDETESKNFLSAYGIPVNQGIVATTEDQAVEIATQIGYPVAIKIESEDIWNKSEIHGVRLGIETEEGVRHVFRFLMQNVQKIRPKARLKGVSVEAMAGGDYELVIASQKDPVFGPVIRFGIDGNDMQLGSDQMIGLPPLNLALAKHLIKSTRAASILKGTKTQQAVPIELMQHILVRFSALIMDFPEIRSIEINPMAISSKGAVALDATIELEDKKTNSRIPFRQLSIEPYPKQWIRKTQLRDGTEITLRPIRPEDEPLEAQLVKDASKESLYFRFFGYIPGIDHQMLSRFTHIDYDREMAIIALLETPEGPKIIGVVRIVGDGWRNSAEYAILVADSWHGQGLGTLLTDYIIEIARSQGYQEVTASFLKTNGSMRRLFKRKGFKISAGKDESDYAKLLL